MSSFPDLSGIYITASGQFGAANAVKDYGKKGFIKVVCHDFFARNHGTCQEGVIQGLIDQVQNYRVGMLSLGFTIMLLEVSFLLLENFYSTLQWQPLKI